MECRETRRLLRTFASGDLPAPAAAEVQAHMVGCADCRLAWAALDPVGASAAYGEERAPGTLRDAVLAAVDALPGVVRTGPARLTGATTAVAVAGVVAVWAAWTWGAPAAAGLALMWLRTVLADVTTAAVVARALLAQVTPALAAAVVAAEAAALYGLTRLAR